MQRRNFDPSLWDASQDENRFAVHYAKMYRIANVKKIKDAREAQKAVIAKVLAREKNDQNHSK